MRHCRRECDTLYRECVYQHTCALSLKVKTEYTDMTRILAAGASQGPLQVIYDFVPPQSFALSLSGGMFPTAALIIALACLLPDV